MYLFRLNTLDDIVHNVIPHYEVCKVKTNVQIKLTVLFLQIKTRLGSALNGDKAVLALTLLEAEGG